MKITRPLGVGLILAATAASWAWPDPPSDAIDQGLYWLYHQQYDKSLASFDTYLSKNPSDPTGYFYRTATSWWHLMQDFDYALPEVYRQFDEDSQRTITTAKALYEVAQDTRTKARACLYWGGAEGLRGRWMVTQGQWIKAYFAGKRGNNLLREAIKLDPTLYDAYMGLGIYDYFTDTLSGVQAVLAAMFIHGDKARGLKELQMAIDKGTHSRIEAMSFLIEIFNSEENTPEKALPIAQELHREFPHSPAFHMMLFSTLYTMKDWPAMRAEAQDFMDKCQTETPWYSKQGLRPARYCLGVELLQNHRDLDGALREFEQILSEGIDSSRWVSYALLRRGQIEDLKGERDKAIADYRKVLDRPDLWGSHPEAHQYLKEPYTPQGQTPN
jgi:tetratricopeptide (TPR) repeat protein